MNANDECTCKNPPKDDGDITCSLHHRCSDGDCTHNDGEIEGYEHEED